MKLIIDIPENEYGHIKEYYEKNDIVEATYSYIYHGIPLKQGHWVDIDDEPHEEYECDKCGYIISTYTANIEPHTEYKYCPNCGARMGSEDEG